MNLSGYKLKTVREDGEFILYRASGKSQTDGSLCPLLVLAPASKRPAPATLRKMEHEFSLKAELDRAWAVQPLALTPYQGRSTLLLEDPGGEPLDELLGAPMELGLFLRLAIGSRGRRWRGAPAGPHPQGHQAGQHPGQRARPARSWLTGFGIASRLPRERQAPEPPEFIAGTLAYMAPEQTGRMNRSIDSRSDLYALGVTLYEMLTGSLPFTASDPMEWVHCHIARQPVPPRERVANVPGAVSAIVMKLLAKTAEERYQTAAGWSAICGAALANGRPRGASTTFALGEHDTPDRLLIPEKLYGREREIATLLAAFERVVQQRRAGAGAGLRLLRHRQVSVVNELHKALVPPRGLFASGKFDQYKRDIPYATPGAGLSELIRPLLGEERGRARPLARRARRGAGSERPAHGRPGPRTEAHHRRAAAGPGACRRRTRKRRFQLVFRRFLGVFARPEHPLALFLDDLQWLDAATLDLLEDLLTQPDVQHLLLIGAYRDNEVTSAHPLMRKLDAIRKAGAARAGDRRLRRSAAKTWAGSLPMLCIATSERAAAAGAAGAREDAPAIRSSRFSFCLRWPRKGCSASTMRRRAGPGTSSAYTPRATPTTSSTSWSASCAACRSTTQDGAAAAGLSRQHRADRVCSRSCSGTSEEEVHATLRKRFGPGWLLRRKGPTGFSTTACRRPPMR